MWIVKYILTAKVIRPLLLREAEAQSCKLLAVVSTESECKQIGNIVWGEMKLKWILNDHFEIHE